MINISRAQKQKRVRNFIGLCLFLALLPTIRSYAPAFQSPVSAHAAEISHISSQPNLLKLTNSERASNGLAPFTSNSLLDAAASAKAQDMATRNYWSHNTPEGAEPWVFITKAGYAYSYAGENLAYGFVHDEGLIKGWMESESHRKNLLNSNYTEVGFGSAISQNYQGEGIQTIVVALYATPK